MLFLFIVVILCQIFYYQALNEKQQWLVPYCFV